MRCNIGGIVRFESGGIVMDDGKQQAGEAASSESQPSSVGKLIDAAVDTGADLVKGKLKKAAKRKLPRSITRAKKSSKKARKSSGSKAKKAPARKSKAKSAKKSRKTKATKRK